MFPNYSVNPRNIILPYCCLYVNADEKKLSASARLLKKKNKKKNLIFSRLIRKCQINIQSVCNVNKIPSF